MFKNQKKSNSRMCLQDGDPSKNNALSRTAMSKIDADLIAILPRNADINPIESIRFRVVEKIFEHDAPTRNITRDNFEEYSHDDGSTIKSVDTCFIDKTIERTIKRTSLLNNRNRTKY